MKKKLKEADNFSSIITNTDTKTKPNMNLDNVSTDEKSQEEKDKLVKKAIDNITQTLKITDELQSILNQINKINNETGANEWKVNEEGNTAILRNKNARIFKQNNNLCLSYNNKVEIFKTVAELHNWLREHNMPLPKNIQLHEAQTLNAEEIERQNNRIKEYGLNILPDSPWYDILSTQTADGHKIGDTIPWTKEQSDELKGEYLIKPGKMGKAAYKNAMRFAPSEKQDKADKIQDFPEAVEDNQLNKDNFWYLSYQNNDPDENLYLNSYWKEGNLLTNNLEQAAIFPSREAAMNEIAAVYTIHDTDAPFKPIQQNGLNECFGVTTADLGSAVQYTGDKKDKKESIDLNETIYGYPGTPFEKKVYVKRFERAVEYLNWLYSKNDNGKRNVDPNVDTNLPQAKEDLNREQIQIKASQHWLGNVSKKEPEKMFQGYLDSKTGKPLDKEAFKARVMELNSKFGLDINPDEDVATVKPPRYNPDDPNWVDPNPEDYAVISPHNLQQRMKWQKEWFTPYFLQNSQGRVYNNMLQRQKEYEDEKNNKVNTLTQDEIFDNNPELKQAYGKIVADNETGTDNDLVSELMLNRNKFNAQEYNALIDKLVSDGNEGNLFINDSVLNILPALKLKESITESFIDTLRKMIGTRLQDTLLTEDDTPADFATGPKNDISVDDNQDSIKITSQNSSQSSSEAPETTDFENDIGMDTGMGNDSPTAEFGDINIGGGNYGPDTGDEQAEIAPQNSPDYRIIDVLVNDNDDTDIIVKVQNTETGETETKHLYELDI